jgi:hypothetical protein
MVRRPTVRPMLWTIIAAVLCCSSCGLAAGLDEIKRAYMESDYDAVIRRGEGAINTWTGKERAEGVRYMAWSYYQKGRMLLAAHEAAAAFTIMYADCLKKKGLTRSDFTPFAQGIAHACLGNYPQALANLSRSSTGRLAPQWKQLSLIWEGCLNERMGKQAERDACWQPIEWSALNMFAREGVRGLLGVFSDQPVKENPDRFTARYNALALDPKRAEPRETKVKLLSLISLGDALSAKGSNEVFYDITGYLAAGRLCIDIGRDLFGELQKDGATMLAEDRFHLGYASFLLQDFGAVVEVLKGSIDGRSRAVLGAALHMKGETQKARLVWQQGEQSATSESKLWLGYAWAKAGLLSDKATEYVRENRLEKPLDYGLLGGFVFDSMKKFDEAFEAYNAGYRYDRRSVFGLDANNGELVIKLSVAAYRASQTDMGFVNQQLLYLGEKYACLKVLHELSTSLTICKKEF